MRPFGRCLASRCRDRRAAPPLTRASRTCPASSHATASGGTSLRPRRGRRRGPRVGGVRGLHAANPPLRCPGDHHQARREHLLLFMTDCRRRCARRTSTRGLLERTKAEGGLRADIEVDDLSLILEQVASLRLATNSGPGSSGGAISPCPGRLPTGGEPMPGPRPAPIELASRWSPGAAADLPPANDVAPSFCGERPRPNCDGFPSRCESLTSRAGSAGRHPGSARCGRSRRSRPDSRRSAPARPDRPARSPAGGRSRAHRSADRWPESPDPPVGCGARTRHHDPAVHAGGTFMDVAAVRRPDVGQRFDVEADLAGLDVDHDEALPLHRIGSRHLLGPDNRAATSPSSASRSQRCRSRGVQWRRSARRATPSVCASRPLPSRLGRTTPVRRGTSRNGPRIASPANAIDLADVRRSREPRRLGTEPAERLELHENQQATRSRRTPRPH